MKIVTKLGLTLVALLFATGCAGNQAARDYYMAVQSAAQAKAQADTARYAALAKMAGNGGEASVAATMAIALTQPTTITPQYVESDALKWAQVLTPGVTTLGLGLVQAGVAKNASNNAAQVQMASFASNEAIQLGQQNMVSNLGQSWATTAAGSADLALAGFNALNTAGGQTVEVALGGLNTADSIATTGITTVGAVGVAGFTQIGLTAEDGINATGNVGLAGMNHLNELGQFGMTTVSATAVAGMNGMEELGKWGMEGIWTTNRDWLGYQTTADTTNAATLTTLVGDANATNLAGQTNYAQVIADMQAAINAMTTQLANPITCQDDGTGTFVCN